MGPKRINGNVRKMLLQCLEARRACCDEARLAQRGPCRLEGAKSGLKLFFIAGPACRGTAALENHAHSTRLCLAKMFIGMGDLVRRRGRELATGEKCDLARVESGLVASERERIALAEVHVTDRKVMCGGRHFVRSHHALASVKNDIGHAEILRTDRGTQAA